jgi:hypothetical protein
MLVLLTSVHHDARFITRNVYYYIFIYNNYASLSLSHTKWHKHILRRIWTAEHCDNCTDHFIYGIAPLLFFSVSGLALRKHFSCFLPGYPSSFGFSCHDTLLPVLIPITAKKKKPVDFLLRWFVWNSNLRLHCRSYADGYLSIYMALVQ